MQDNMAISCGSRAHLEEESVAQVFSVSQKYWSIIVNVHEEIASIFSLLFLLVTAVNVPNVSDVWIPLLGVVLLCEGD